MKKIIIALLLMGFCHQGIQAQIKSKAKLPNNGSFPITSSNLDLEQIKGHINSGKFCYTINASMTAIFPPKSLNPVKAVDGHYNSTKYVKVERTYLRTNGLLVRSDKDFNRNFGNNFEVLIYPQRRDSKKVDENQVKLTWRIPESRLRTFHLQNVSVRYKRHGILINGDYEVDGIVFGVTIALIPNGCII